MAESSRHVRCAGEGVIGRDRDYVCRRLVLAEIGSVIFPSHS